VRTKHAFEQNLTQNRQGFLQLLNQNLALMLQVLTAYGVLSARLKQATLQQPEFKTALADLKTQVEHLFAPGFIQRTPLVWLKRYPLYLKGIEQRIEKLIRNPKKDAESLADVIAVQKNYLGKLAKKDVKYFASHDPLLSFRWKIEELRISLFAQTLGTVEPVSKIRLLKLLEKLS
jgi:ATP-dependent helicase HrpA